MEISKTKLILVIILTTWFASVGAIEVDSKAACEALLRADPVTRAFVRLAFPSIYGTPSASRQAVDKKHIDRIKFDSPATLEIHQRLTAFLSGTAIVPPQSAELQTSIAAGVPIDKMLFSTHAIDETFERAIAEALVTDPDLRVVPRMTLASEDFPMRTKEFLAQTSLLHYSVAGRLSLVPLVRTAYLTGGFGCACLARTARDLVWKALSSGQKEITLIFISKLIYHENHGGILFSPNASIFSSPSTYRPEIVGEYLRAWFLDEKELSGERAMKLAVHEGRSRMMTEKTWEGFLSPIGHPDFTVHVVIDAR